MSITTFLASNFVWKNKEKRIKPKKVNTKILPIFHMVGTIIFFAKFINRAENWQYAYINVQIIRYF